MFKLICTLLLLLLSLTTVVDVTEAAEPIDIVTEELPPYQTVKDGIIGGINTEIIKAAAKAAGLEYTLRAYPWARAYKMALQNKNVCIYSIARLDNREDKFQWAGQLANIQAYFYKLASRKDIVVDSLEDAKRFNTAVVRNYSHHQLLKSNGFEEGKNYYVTNDTISAVKMLFAGGGVSLIIINDETLRYWARKAGLDYLALEQAFKIPELNMKLHVAFSLKTPAETVTRFSKALEQMKTDGTFDAIWEKWRTDQQNQ